MSSRREVTMAVLFFGVLEAAILFAIRQAPQKSSLRLVAAVRFRVKGKKLDNLATALHNLY